MGFFTPVTGQSIMWGPTNWGTRKPAARLTYAISQEMVNMNFKGDLMRVVFTLEIKAEIPSHDVEKRKVLIELMTQAAKRLHTQTVLLSNKVSPNMDLIIEDGQHGRQTIELFEGNRKND